MRTLPQSPIATNDQLRARSAAQLSLGGAAVLAVMAMAGFGIFLGLVGEFPRFRILVLAFAACGVAAWCLAVIGVLARRVERHGGMATWKEDRAAAQALREQLRREPLAHEILEQALKMQKAAGGMRPETIRRFLAARGNVVAIDMKERNELRLLLLYTVRFTKQLKEQMREGAGARDQVEVLGHSYPPLELDKLCLDIAAALAEILKEETPAPIPRRD